MTVFEKIEAQQKGHEDTPVWMVGEQLKEICADPACAAIVAEDLESESMSIQKAEAKMKEYADNLHRQKKSSSICIPSNVAERIIREFYGLPDAKDAKTAPAEPVEEPTATVPDLFSFF